jgi:hypothetical protein
MQSINPQIQNDPSIAIYIPIFKRYHYSQLAITDVHHRTTQQFLVHKIYFSLP